MWIKIKEFFAWLWEKIKMAWKWIVGAVLAIALIIASVTAIDTNNSDENQKTEARPEIAQLFEPSIGTPLPADTTTNEGMVDSAQTTEPAPAPAPEPVTYSAPATGVDDDEPFVYENTELGFKVNLEGRTQVIEASEGTKFQTKSGQLLFYVVAVNTKQTSTEIIEQLKNSPGVTSISQSSFQNLSAVSFIQNGQNGLTILGNKSFYLIGDKTTFSRFSQI